ncbi:MAG TPA: glycine--tRNA ligase subunit beta [Spirochaetota bacterium]|nr:glycine--tRNA ligase subunit beta [Spirochaetota bacterium]HPJ33494.1 glycine--tRNA ligase subunit beta [Spirochaetota bacterium]
MLKNANFLCEIGTEEIPAGYIPAAVKSLKTVMTDRFRDERIDFSEIEVYATPRRFAVLISGLAENQRSETVELKGPSAKAAYDQEGAPTKALQGFLKGNGLEPGDVEARDTEKGSYVFASKKLESGKTVDIIPGIIENIVLTLPFPKRMKWSDKKVTFPRPIAYFLLMFNDSVIPFEIEGIKSGNLTRGHFVQANKMIEISSISDYADKLRENCVIIDQDERKEIIRKGLLAAAESAGGILYEDEELLDTVTYLVENPHIIVCEFDKNFLEIPDIVLIAEMKEHQKYFAITDKNGKLMNKFLVTANNPENENVKKGNVKVISARFTDAGFFYKEDAKIKLEDRVDSLKKVLFHKELGSIYDKIVRVGDAAGILIELLGIDSGTAEKIKRAVLLSKADLDTAMVYEFASLQGQVGRIYALNEGEAPEVADAINDHYRPRFSGDIVPSGIVSIVLSIAEKIDNILGSFSVGNIPKGSQDPYALRRQANAIVELIIRNNLKLQLGEAFEQAAENYKDGATLTGKIVEFVNTRAKTIFTEDGFRYDEIDACMIEGNTDYLELHRRAESLNSFRKNEKFSELLLGFKRMNNILAGFRKDNKDYKLSFNESLMEEKEEKELYAFFNSKSAEMAELISGSQYVNLFELMIEAKPLIDAFFDKVLVMDKRLEMRDNRLSIIEGILNNFRTLIDFSKIADTAVS